MKPNNQTASDTDAVKAQKQECSRSRMRMRRSARAGSHDVELWLETQALFGAPEAKVALRELKRLRSAVEWALGSGKDGFRPRMSGEGPYWWRAELRARALGKPNAEFIQRKSSAEPGP